MNNKPPLDRWRTLALQMAGDLLQQGDCYCDGATKHKRCAVCYAEDAITLNAHEIENPDSPADHAGNQIRSLLLALRAPDHSESEEQAATCSYDTAALRGQALERAGICFAAPGEMKPQCGCKYPASPQSLRKGHHKGKHGCPCNLWCDHHWDEKKAAQEENTPDE